MARGVLLPKAAPVQTPVTPKLVRCIRKLACCATSSSHGQHSSLAEVTQHALVLLLRDLTASIALLQDVFGRLAPLPTMR